MPQNTRIGARDEGLPPAVVAPRVDTAASLSLSFDLRGPATSSSSSAAAAASSLDGGLPTPTSSSSRASTAASLSASRASTADRIGGVEHRAPSRKSTIHGILAELPPIVEAKRPDSRGSSGGSSQKDAGPALAQDTTSALEPSPRTSAQVPAPRPVCSCALSAQRPHRRAAGLPQASASFDSRHLACAAEEVLAASAERGELSMLELLELAHSCQWHLAGPQVPGSTVDYEKGTKAILIVVQWDDIDGAQRVVNELSDCKEELPPVLALLTGVSEPDDVAPILGAQRELLAMGIEDVLLNARSKQQVKLAIAMGLMRTRDRAQVIRGIEDDLKAAFEDEVRSKVQAIEAKLSEPKMGFFWQAIHRTFEGFPHLDRKLIMDPAPGAQIGPCELEKVLGRGRFGTVYAVTNTSTGEHEALKVIDKDRLVEVEAVAGLWREIHYLGKLDHENVVRLAGAMQGPRHVYVRMELAGRCSLFRSLRVVGGRFAADATQELFSQIVAGVAHCHSRGVAHRDLKPENIALCEDSWQIKLVDFGSASSVSKRRHDLVGTMPFMAPEVLAVRGETSYWPAGADVFSSAVVLLEMLCGINTLMTLLGWRRGEEPCGERAVELQAFFSERPDAIRETLEEHIGHLDPDLAELLDGMLALDPDARWPAPEAEASPWVVAGARRRR